MLVNDRYKNHHFPCQIDSRARKKPCISLWRIVFCSYDFYSIVSRSRSSDRNSVKCINPFRGRDLANESAFAKVDRLLSHLAFIRPIAVIDRLFFFSLRPFSKTIFMHNSWCFFVWWFYCESQKHSWCFFFR